MELNNTRKSNKDTLFFNRVPKVKISSLTTNADIFLWQLCTVYSSYTKRVCYRGNKFLQLCTKGNTVLLQSTIANIYTKSDTSLRQSIPKVILFFNRVYQKWYFSSTDYTKSDTFLQKSLPKVTLCFDRVLKVTLFFKRSHKVMWALI